MKRQKLRHQTSDEKGRQEEEASWVGKRCQARMDGEDQDDLLADSLEGGKRFVRQKFYLWDSGAATPMSRQTGFDDGLFSNIESCNSADNSGMGRVEAGKCDFCEPWGMEDIFGWVETRLEPFSEVLRRVKPTGGVFPLPFSFSRLTHLFPNASSFRVRCFRGLVIGLNSLYGVTCELDFPPSDFQVRILNQLWSNLEQVVNWDERCEELSWDRFFSVKGVGYKGDEVCTARRIRWENVASALPDEVGGVDLSEVVELGSLHYTLNFEDNCCMKMTRLRSVPLVLRWTMMIGSCCAESS